MTAVLAIAAVLGIAYVIRRKPTVALPEAERVFIEEQLFPSEARLPIYSPGMNFYHKETGEKIEILQAPEIVNGEYKIQWPNGEIGYIHESSLKEFFE